MSLTIDKSKVLEAAKDCPEAKKVLQTLFPEVFEEDKYFNLYHLIGRYSLVFSYTQAVAAGFRNNSFFQLRDAGEFRNKAFYLDDINYNWELKKDSYGKLVLIPTKKLRI